MPKRDLYRILFPKQRKALTTFGEDLLLAMKRRGWTKQMMCDRTGFDNKTINNNPIINFFILLSSLKYKKDAKSYLLSKTLHPLINPYVLCCFV